MSIRIQERDRKYKKRYRLVDDNNVLTDWHTTRYDAYRKLHKDKLKCETKS